MNNKNKRILITQILSTVCLLIANLLGFLYGNLFLFVFILAIGYSIFLPYVAAKQMVAKRNHVTTWAFSSGIVIIVTFASIIISMLVIELVTSSKDIIFGTYSDLKNIMKSGQ